MQKINNLKIFTNINENIPKNCLVSVGFFDGVHLGHQYIINELKQRASSLGKEELLITMWPHPAFYFGGEIKLLTTLEEKIEKLEKLSLKNLLILEFNSNLADKTSEEFINDILVEKVGASEIIMGYNNSFGHKRDSAKEIKTDLIKISRLNKFELPNASDISSSIIRKKLEQGLVDEVFQLLGCEYSITGVVEDGYKNGRKIGFPTANLGSIDNNKLIPSNGVYIVEVNIGNKWLPAMLNIGTRPSFDGKDTSVEFHVLDFNRDLYSQKITVKFLKHVRSERKFDDINSLIDQLYKDKEITQSYFS